MNGVTRFRQRPVVIEAVQLVDGESFDAIMKWRRSHTAALNSGGHVPGGRGWWLRIETPKGDMTAVQGDWIIRGVKGEFSTCKPDIFDMTYEPAGEAK